MKKHIYVIGVIIIAGLIEFFLQADDQDFLAPWNFYNGARSPSSVNNHYPYGYGRQDNLNWYWAISYGNRYGRSDEPYRYWTMYGYGHGPYDGSYQYWPVYGYGQRRSDYNVPFKYWPVSNEGQKSKHYYK